MQCTPVFSWSAAGSCLLYSQDLAEHLVIHAHCLTSMDHKELSSLYNLGQESLRWTMDRRVALAMANLNIPQNWNVLGSHSGNGENRIMLPCWESIPGQTNVEFGFLLYNSVWEHLETFKSIYIGWILDNCPILTDEDVFIGLKADAASLTCSFCDGKRMRCK